LQGVARAVLTAALARGHRVLIVDSGNNRAQAIDGLARLRWRSPE